MMNLLSTYILTGLEHFTYSMKCACVMRIVEVGLDRQNVSQELGAVSNPKVSDEKRFHGEK